MSSQRRVNISIIFCASLVASFLISFASYFEGREGLRKEAVDKKLAEYYLDGDVKKWRWITDRPQP